MLILAGTGYALSSSISNTDNSVVTSESEINLYKGESPVTITSSVFSNGEITYRISENKYIVRDNQVISLSDGSTYLKSNLKGDISISIIWSEDLNLFQKITAAIGDKSIVLNHQNSYTATFTGDNSVDTSNQPLKVTLNGITQNYESTVDPREISFSVKFTLITTA